MTNDLNGESTLNPDGSSPSDMCYARDVDGDDAASTALPGRASTCEVEQMLALLKVALQPFLHAAGLSQSDHAVLEDMSWLEYRGTDSSAPFILGIYHHFGRRRITAEAWRPRQVRQAVYEGKAERAADQQQVWSYEDEADIRHLRREIADTVLAWCAARSQRAS